MRKLKKPQLQQIKAYYNFDKVVDYISKKYGIKIIKDWDEYDLMDWVYDNNSSIENDSITTYTVDLESALRNDEIPEDILKLLTIIKEEFNTPHEITFAFFDN